MLTLEDFEINEQSSGSGSSGSGGTGSGSASGSGGSGSVGNDSGSGGNDSGSVGTTASDGSGGSDFVEQPTANANGNTNDVSGNQNSVNFRNIRSERQRANRSVRLGSAVRSGNSDDRNTDGSAGTRETVNNENDREPVIRLGARTQGNPKSVKPKTEGKSKLSEVKALIKTFIESAFEVPAIALKQDFWRLSKDESAQLSDALIQWLESMPSADQSKIADFVGKHLPLVNLFMVAGFIISERVKASIAIYKVTQSANRFSQSVNGAGFAPAENSTVKTPMDSMFNN